MVNKYTNCFAERTFFTDCIMIMQLLFGLPFCKKWWNYLVIGGIYSALNIGILFSNPENVWVHTAMMYVAFLVIVWVLSKRRFLKMFLYTIPAIMLQTQWANVLRMLDELFHLEKLNLDGVGPPFGPFYYMADFFAVILLGWWISYVHRTGKCIRLKAGETVVLLLFCMLSPSFVNYMEALGSSIDSKRFPIICLAFMIIMNVAIFYGIIHRSMSRYYRGMAENYKEQFSSEYDYFKDYREKQKTTADFRHDWNNHMLLLQGMLENGDYEKAAEYFHSLTAEQIPSGRRILSGNDVVDIILSAKAEKMEEQQIKVTCNGGLEPLSFMGDVDICILFSNLIDNSIEANAKCEENRFLRIQATNNPSTLMIAVSNCMSGELQEKEGRILSSKEDSEAHGIGTQSIFAIVRKYKGEYSVQAKNQIFTITMTFPLDHLEQNQSV